MKILSNAHTHTNFCDGQNTAEQMVQAAVALGFTDLGFSAHSPAPFDPTCPGLTDEAAYQKEIFRLREEYKGRLCILCGVEQDLYGPVQNRQNYDYIIGSVHYLKMPDGTLITVDATPKQVVQARERYFEGDGLRFAQAFYETTLHNVQQNRPEIVGHFDLLVKHNRDGAIFDEEAPAYRQLALETVDAVAQLCDEYGGMIELNTGGITRGYRDEPYPAVFLLRHLAQRGARLMVNSDSHSADTINAGFADAVALLQSLGFSSLSVLKNGSFAEMKI